MFQVKEQDKTSEKVLTEMEINDLPVKEFKIMVIMMLTWEKNEWTSTKRNIRKYQKEVTELKDTVIYLKNTLEEFSSRLDEAEGKINLCQREHKSLNQKNSPHQSMKKKKEWTKNIYTVVWNFQIIFCLLAF